MERIICDSYVKGEKRTWDLDKDNPKNQEFNRKILAVNNMFGWLYQNGILQDVSFQIKDYSDITYFAFDAKDLEAHRDAMAASGIPDSDLALRHIFDEPYTPCLYSGAIELTWTMMGYRDFDGSVSRSWECDLVKHLSADAVLDVEQIKDKKGVKEAIRAAFAYSDFEPSDITKDGAILTVMPLSNEHIHEVSSLDKMSGNNVSQYLEDNEDFAWGAFVRDKLVGYCTIGFADCEPAVKDVPGYCADSLLLSDVFVDPRYRNLGCGSFLVDHAIRLRTKKDHQLVFLGLLDNTVSDFYKKIGFSMVADRHMVRDERSLGDLKFQEDFDRAFAFFSSKDKSMVDNRDYLFSHGEKLIVCYEQDIHLDLIDVDCWVQYEKLLGEFLGYEEYSALNSVLDGDPHDIDENDVEAITFLREALQKYREQGELSDSHPILSLIEGTVLRGTESDRDEAKDTLAAQISVARSRASSDDLSGTKPALKGPDKNELFF